MFLCQHKTLQKLGLTYETLLINGCEKLLTLIKNDKPHDCLPELLDDLGLVLTEFIRSS